MAYFPLPIIEKGCGIEIEDALPALLARRLDVRGALAVATNFRRIAISKLFMSGLPDGFFADLSRGARAFLHFLEGADDAQKVTGRAAPFFDAVACADDDAALRIARASRSTWHQGKEYEDDFLYAWFLMRRTAAAPPAELDAILARWELVLEGGNDPKLGLCRGLLAKDQRSFDAGLEELVLAHRTQVAEATERDQLLPEDAGTTAKVSVELLALLRLAEGAGLATEREVPFAPSVARRTDRARLPGPDDWRRIRSYRELA